MNPRESRWPSTPASLPPPDEALLLGTSEGFLQLHSAASGALLLRQRLHHSACVGAAVRWAGMGSDPGDLSADVTLTFADAVARVPAWEVWAAVRWHAGRGGGGGHWWSGGGGGGAAAASSAAQHQLSFSKFSLPKGAGVHQLFFAVLFGWTVRLLAAATSYLLGPAMHPKPVCLTSSHPSPVRRPPLRRAVPGTPSPLPVRRAGGAPGGAPPPPAHPHGRRLSAAGCL